MKSSVLRSIGAMVAGLIVIVVLSTVTDAAMHHTGVFPPAGQPMAGPLFLLPLAYRILYGIGGCYLAARLAPGRPLKHAMVLGAIGTVVGLVGAAATWNRGPEFGPKWYALAVAATALPCAWAGGRLGAYRR